MIFCIYGIDTYRSRKKVREIIEECHKKYGSELSIRRFDAEEDDPETLRGIFEGQSLFSSAKHVVVVNYAFSGQERVAEILRSKIPAVVGYRDMIVVLRDGEITGDKQKLFNALAPSFSRTQEMKSLSGSQMIRWVSEEAKERGLDLDPDELKRVGMAGDSWGIAHELDKMASGLRYDETVVRERGRPYTVFQLGDTLGHVSGESLRILHGLFKQGEDTHRLFSYIAGHARTIAVAALANQQGREIPKELGIHPFVAKKAALQARGLSIVDAVLLVRRVLEEDYRIKTGLSTPRESLERLLMNPVTAGGNRVNKKTATFQS